MRIQHKAFAVIAAMLCSTLAWADSTTLGEISEAAKRSGDKSREALVSIYGQVVNNPLASAGGSGDTPSSRISSRCLTAHCLSWVRCGPAISYSAS